VEVSVFDGAPFLAFPGAILGHLLQCRDNFTSSYEEIGD
jgi:hypothetical protein